MRKMSSNCSSYKGFKQLNGKIIIIIIQFQNEQII
jgi:hypothetical protein